MLDRIHLSHTLSYPVVVLESNLPSVRHVQDTAAEELRLIHVEDRRAATARFYLSRPHSTRLLSISGGGAPRLLLTVYHTDPPSDDRYHLMDARANGETMDVVDGHRYDSDHGANVR